MHGQQAAVDQVVLGRVSDGDALQRHLGTATAKPARPRLVPDRLDVVRQAAPAMVNPSASRYAASSRPMRRSFHSAPRGPDRRAAAAVGSARCWSPAQSKSTVAARRRARLKVIEGFGKDEIHAFVLAIVAPTPGW